MGVARECPGCVRVGRNHAKLGRGRIEEVLRREEDEKKQLRREMEQVRQQLHVDERANEEDDLGLSGDMRDEEDAEELEEQATGKSESRRPSMDA